MQGSMVKSHSLSLISGGRFGNWLKVLFIQILLSSRWLNGSILRKLGRINSRFPSYFASLDTESKCLTPILYGFPHQNKGS